MLEFVTEGNCKDKKLRQIWRPWR